MAISQVETRPPLELSGLTPYVEEHFVDQVLRRGLIANQTENEPEDPHMMPREQHLHGETVSVRDPSDEHFVCCLHRVRPSRTFGRGEDANGFNRGVDFSPKAVDPQVKMTESPAEQTG